MGKIRRKGRILRALAVVVAAMVEVAVVLAALAAVEVV
jgi:hypothetical protein